MLQIPREWRVLNSSIVDESRVLKRENPRREPGVFGENADFCLRPYFFLGEPTLSDERAIFLMGFQKELGALDGWMLTDLGAGFTSHQGLHHHGPRHNSFAFLHGVAFEKRGFS